MDDSIPEDIVTDAALLVLWARDGIGALADIPRAVLERGRRYTAHLFEYLCAPILQWYEGSGEFPCHFGLREGTGEWLCYSYVTAGLLRDQDWGRSLLRRLELAPDQEVSRALELAARYSSRAEYGIRALNELAGFLETL